jgi:hypothetical protein
MADKDKQKASPKRPGPSLPRRHLRLGWWSLLFFLLLGAVLEGMHGLKVGWYLDVGNETRRLMWTLAHSHGTLLSVIHLVFAASVRSSSGFSGTSRRIASRSLMAALGLLPAGFFLGGITVHGGDPGIGILLVPPGALALVVAVFLTARGMSAADDAR